MANTAVFSRDSTFTNSLERFLNIYKFRNNHRVVVGKQAVSVGVYSIVLGVYIVSNWRHSVHYNWSKIHLGLEPYNYVYSHN